MNDLTIQCERFGPLYRLGLMLHYLVRYRETIALNLWTDPPTYDPSDLDMSDLIRIKADRAITERMRRLEHENGKTG